LKRLLLLIPFLLIPFLLIAASAFGQGQRFGDQQPVQSGQTPGGPIFSVPNAVINWCNSPANGAPCTNKAQTYTDATLSVPCPTSTQIVLATTSTCVGTTDAFGNWGVWVAPGTYSFTITIPNGNSIGPFSVTITAGGGIDIRPLSNTFTGPLNNFVNILQVGGLNVAGTSGTFTIGDCVGILSIAPLVFNDAGSCSGSGSGSVVASPQFQVFYQPNNGTSATAQGSNITTDATGNNLNIPGNDCVKGPEPWIATCQYNMRAVTSDFTATATVNGTTAISFTGGSFASFKNGDGIMIPGAGAATSLSTPSAPTVTPSLLSGPDTPNDTVVAPAGSTTRSYCESARDANVFGAYTACSSTGTTTTGNTLGKLTANMTSQARSGQTVTITLASSLPCAVGAIIYDTNSTDSTFSGFFKITLCNGGTSPIFTTQISYSQGYSTTLPIPLQGGGNSTNAATGGTASVYSVDKLTFPSNASVYQYLIYTASGSFLGYTRPGEVNWTNFGAAAPTRNAWYPASAPASAGLGALSTTIVSGGGTSSVVVANAATQSASGLTAYFDDGPTLSAACAAANPLGPMRISTPAQNSNYYINSPTLCQATAVTPAGEMFVNEALTVANINWNGSQGGQPCGSPQFDYGEGACIVVEGAYPGVIFTGTDHVRHANISAQANGLAATVTGSGQTNSRFDNYSCALPSNDVVGQCIVSYGAYGIQFHDSLFSTNNSSGFGYFFGPLLLERNDMAGVNGAGSMILDNIFCVGRCFGWESNPTLGSNARIQIYTNYNQQVVAPVFIFGPGNNVDLSIEAGANDTSTTAMVANWGAQLTAVLSFLPDTSGETGGRPAIVTGAAVPALQVNWVGNQPWLGTAAPQIGQNVGLIQFGGGPCLGVNMLCQPSTSDNLDVNGNADIIGALTANNFIDNALTPGTSPICPNGSGGDFTTVGCSSGGGSLPSGAQGQPFINTNGATTYATSPQQSDASVQTGADDCAKINTNWTTISGGISSLGGVNDARAFSGTPSCAASPLGNDTSLGGTLLLGGAQFQASTTWVAQNGLLIRGSSAHPVSSPVGTPRGSTIQATTSFPGSSTLFQVGTTANTGSVALEHVRLSMYTTAGGTSNPAAGTVYQNLWGQEGTRLEDVFLDGGSAFDFSMGTSAAQNMGPLIGVVAGMNGVNSTSAINFQFGIAGTSQTIANTSAIQLSAGGTANAAAQVDCMTIDFIVDLWLESGHCENTTVGIEIGANNLAHNIFIGNYGFTGTSGKPMTSAIDLASTNSTNILVENISAPNSNLTNILKDNSSTNPCTITSAGESGLLGWYWRSATGTFTSSPQCPDIFPAHQENFANSTIKLPTAAGFTATSSSEIGVDSSTGNTHVLCAGVDCVVGSGGGGGSPGGSTNAVQYNAGGGTFGGLNSPVTPGTYSVVFNVPGASSVAPTVMLPGVPVSASASATPSVAQANLAGVVQTSNGTTSTATSIPAGSGLSANFTFVLCNTGTVVNTATPTTSTINSRATLVLQGAAANTNPPCAFVWTDSSNNYWSALIPGTDSNGRLAAASMPAFTGDCTNSAGALAFTCTAINNTAFAGTNGHLVSFGAGNIPADSGLVAANVVTMSIAPTANNVCTFVGTSKICTSGPVTNAMLSNPATTVNGVTCTLGSTCTITSGLAFPATVTSGVSGAVPYFSNSTTLSASALLCTNCLMTGGGAGGAPATGNGDFTYATHTLAGGASAIFNLSALTASNISFPSGLALTSPALTTPSLGVATATSLLVSGISDGKAPVTITTGTTATLGAGTYQGGYTFNQEATAGAGVTYTLPATAAGLQYCVKNSIVSGSGAPDTGVLTVYPPSGSFVILNGVVNTVGGGGTHGVVSGGAAADSACFIAIDSTHWDVYPNKGTWTEN
jgi:hypothetical protein